MSQLLCVLLLTFLVTGGAWGQPEPPMDATQGLLPRTVIPHRYQIDLNPDLHALTFTGSERVDIEVLRPTRSVVLNALELQISRAQVDGGPQAGIGYDPEAQTATLAFPSPLAPGKHVLSLDFRGKINRSVQGFYYIDYQVPGQAEKERLLATYLESTEARRLFPGWDEPSFRSIFELSVEIPGSLRAVSNMPVKHLTPLKSGRQRVEFAPTPPMASYLVALCVGDFEQVGGQVDGIQVGMVTTRGKAQNGRYALEILGKLLPYYREYFGVAYPLPKLDLIALPGAGGMENWGAIIAAESTLLFDPARSPQSTKERVFEMIAHEVAHQWFGDLVTMAWWNDLWLNEAFAAWISFKALDRFNPSWHNWRKRLLSFREEAMESDARTTSHPILQPIKNPTEAASALDAITYFKGQAVIIMLEDYLGPDTFRQGIRAYIGSHRYSSATTADLWQALSRVSGRDVDKVAGPWVRQAGFPLVKVGSHSEKGRNIKQERFTLAPLSPSTQAILWPVPICWHRLDGTDNATTTSFLTVPQTLSRDAGPLKLNWGNRGFYRVQYDRDDVRSLTDAFPRLPMPDRLNLLSDTWALAQAGLTPATDYLALTEKLSTSDGLEVWDQVVEHLNYIDDCHRGSSDSAAWKNYYRRRLELLFNDLGWEGQGEAELRSLVLKNLGKLGHPEVVAGAWSRFQDARRGRPVAPELRRPVMMVTGRYADPATYEQLHLLGQRALAMEDRELYYSALAAVQDQGLAQKTLELALGDELPSIPLVVMGVAREHPALAWQFFQEHHKMLLSRIQPVFGYGLAADFTLWLDHERIQEVRRFFDASLPPEAAPTLARSLEKAELRHAFRQRELPRIDAWVGGKQCSRSLVPSPSHQVIKQSAHRR